MRQVSTEREVYLTRFLEELLFVYNDEHPQQALRRRIEAALRGDWDSALMLSHDLPKEKWDEYSKEGIDDIQHPEFLPDAPTSSSRRNPAEH